MKKPSILLLLLPLILTGCAEQDSSTLPSQDSTPAASESVGDETSTRQEITESKDSSKTEVAPETTTEVVTTPEESTTTPVETETEVSPSETETEIPPVESETEPGGDVETSTEQPPISEVIKTIPEIKEKGIGFESKVNEIGIYVSNIKVELKNIQLIAAQDMISGNQEYIDKKDNYNYKLMMSDGENIIFVACDYDAYSMVADNEQKCQRYNVNGYIGYFNNQIEVFSVGEQVTWLKNEATIDYDYESLSTPIGIPEFYAEGEKLLLNDKGVVYSENLYTVKARCLANNYNQNNVIFGNGDYILEIHSHKYITNRFTAGKSYNITGFISSYRYKLGMELADYNMIDEEVEEGVNFNKDCGELMSAADLYKFNYDSDSKLAHPTNLNYTRLFYKPIKINGIFDLAEKNGRYNGIIGDTVYTGKNYIKLANIKDKKFVSMVNENYVNLRDDVARVNTPLLDFIHERIEFNLLPVIWDQPLQAPKVYVYDYVTPTVIQ